MGPRNFHSKKSLLFSLTALSTSLLHHHVTCLLDGPLVQPHVFSAASRLSLRRDHFRCPVCPSIPSPANLLDSSLPPIASLLNWVWKTEAVCPFFNFQVLRLGTIFFFLASLGLSIHRTPMTSLCCRAISSPAIALTSFTTFLCFLPIRM